MPRLLVLACSARKHRAPHPIPAWYRYDGVFFRLCKRLEADHRFPTDVRIRILSAEHGIISREAPIPWYDRRLDAERAEELRASVTGALCRAIEAEQVCEVYLALGRRYLAAVGSLPPHVRVRGAPERIGTMQSHLRRWLAAPAAAGEQLQLAIPTCTPQPGRHGPATRARAR